MRAADRAFTFALVLLAAQAPRDVAAAKRKKPPSPAATAEKRVSARPPLPPTSPTPRAVVPAGGRRGDPATGGATVPLGDGTEGTTTGADGQAPIGAVRPAKTKVYTFGAMDVEGKLKTPQLLYFLNRVKLELEMSAPDHRSFMKELEKTADDPNL